MMTEHSNLSFWFFFFEQKLLMLEADDNSINVPLLDETTTTHLGISHQLSLGFLNNYPCNAGILVAEPSIFQFKAYGLRDLFPLVDEQVFKLAIRAYHLLNWDLNSQYCGVCGFKTKHDLNTNAKVCPQCGNLSFPKISPAIIVAITRGNQILLAHSNRFSNNFYSVLAGFVEPGETLEECVKREVYEEVGITIKNIKYFGSQPWPFPDSLMIAFTAEYAGGEINIDGEEISDAQWFTIDDLPQIPGKVSIARKLIDWFINK